MADTQMGADFSPYGTDLFGDNIKPRGQGPVAERFVIPPFSILDAKQGEWQARKQAWLSMGIKGETGRDAVPGGSKMVAGYVNGERQTGLVTESDVSIFDPVLCELAYRWWAPRSGQVVDPFAGGSVRGIVAASLGLDYWGCDLRSQQIEANEAQADEICGERRPVWICDDSMIKLEYAPSADFIFSCPPYGNLEKYSDSLADLSNMDWHAFMAAYRRIILKATLRLKDDRFACVVVGDFRDKAGFYRNFVSETISAFQLVGLKLYNEAVLATSVGSACMRVSRQFNASRKLAKTHQNVLVFVKGDPKRAAEACSNEQS